MKLKSEGRETVTRLAICLVLAVLLYLGGEWLCSTHEIPLWETYHPWLEENKIQAIAVMTAVIFGLSLLVLPLEKVAEEVCEELFEPCEPI